jgi:DNA-binding NarL/FixJ family response regulator
MQMVTVAIADTDLGRRTKLEQFLQGEQGIRVLTNIMPHGDDISHEGDISMGDQADQILSAVDQVVARIAQLKPRILFVNLDLSIERDCALLEALHRECPETCVLLLTDKSVQEEQIMQALANGARGWLSHETDPFYFLKAVHVVDRGEIWVTRRMLGKIMDKVVH